MLLRPASDAATPAASSSISLATAFLFSETEAAASLVRTVVETGEESQADLLPPGTTASGMNFPDRAMPAAKPRVLVCGAHAGSLLHFRGNLLAELQARGFEAIACGPEPPPRVRRGLAELGVRYQNIPCERTGLALVGDLKLFRALFDLCRRERPQLALFYTIKPVLYGSLAARLAGVPGICSMITGLGYALTGNTLARRALKTALMPLLSAGLRGNRVVLFQNPDDLEHFRQLGVLSARQKTVLINGSGVDLERFGPAPLPARTSFLLAARLIADKGIRDYVAAARILRERHPQAHFRLVGGYDINPAALSQSEVEGWVREGLIEYLGWLQDVRPAIAGSSVYVLPSYYPEGIPRSILEAMAMGRPIITTDKPGCRETVSPGVNGLLVPARDPAALAAALEHFVTNPAEICRMGGESRRMAIEKYDVHKVNAVILKSMGVGP